MILNIDNLYYFILEEQAGVRFGLSAHGKFLGDRLLGEIRFDYSNSRI
jgi:hypothetical protein